MFFVTTEPAPTITFLPISKSGNMVELEPICEYESIFDLPKILTLGETSTKSPKTQSCVMIELKYNIHPIPIFVLFEMITPCNTLQPVPMLVSKVPILESLLTVETNFPPISVNLSYIFFLKYGFPIPIVNLLST